MRSTTVTEFAPAKINLYLHVTGKRDDGYHLLDSLVAFADVGDTISIKPAEGFSFSMTGPFADTLSHHNNLAVRAAHRVCERIGKAPDMHITLTKNLPVGAGIGGGSADAAATARGTLALFGIKTNIDDILASLGADVPMCYYSEPSRISGIGEKIELLTSFPAIPALLVNPLIPCATQKVFQALRNVSNVYNAPPAPPSDQDGLFRYLNNTCNDLTDAAISIVPEIGHVLFALKQTNARVTRMSGSGATCYALFDHDEERTHAATRIKTTHPSWWVHSGNILGA